MDAPPIQYARTADGVNIAYITVGEGPPLVFMPAAGVNHVGLAWSLPHFRAFLLMLSERRKVLMYDYPGSGLSAAEGSFDWSLDWNMRHLAGFADAVGLNEFDLLGEMDTAAVAIRFAVRHPSRVGSLVLWHPWTERPNFGRVEPAVPLVSADVGLFAESFMEVLGAEVDATEEYQAILAQSLPQEAWVPGMETVYNRDSTSDLPDVSAPCLVLHRRESALHVETSAKVAALLASSEFRLLDGRGFMVWDGDPGEVVGAIEAFLPQRSLDGVTSFRTILFTDLESSTALTQSLGDAKAQEILRGHNEAVRTALEAHEGEEVKHMGDGIMAAFGSAVSAVEAALQIQRDLAGGEVRVRIGLNAGEPIQEDDDYFGAAVQLAARVCDRAEPGQVLVPQVVRDLCRGKIFTFEDQGEATLKGFPEPVRLFVVGEGA